MCENEWDIVKNSELSAMQMLQREMAGEADRAGLISDADSRSAVQRGHLTATHPGTPPYTLHILA